jgi:hypothetical protein
MAYGLTLGEMSDTRRWVFLKDAGPVVRPEFHVIANYAEMTTTEDSFNVGEIGRSHIVWSQKNLGTFKDTHSLIRGVASIIDVSSNPKDWGIFDDGRIECSYHVDEENSEATPRELAEWKAGRTRLWSATVTVWVVFARVWEPDVATMKKTLGLQVF